MTRTDCRWNCMSKEVGKMIFRKAEKERMKTIYCKQRNMLYRVAVLRLQKISEHKNSACNNRILLSSSGNHSSHRREENSMKEMHILELSKLPPEEKNETSLLQWMRFLGGKTERILKKWQRKILNWKKHMTCWIN